VPKETGAVIFGGHGKVGADTNIAYLPQRSVIDRDFPGIWRRLGKADALRTIGLVDLAERANRRGNNRASDQTARCAEHD